MKTNGKNLFTDDDFLPPGSETTGENKIRGAGELPGNTEGRSEEIHVNKKLEAVLEKYIHSFDKVHDQIELKGKLIELIRKI